MFVLHRGCIKVKMGEDSHTPTAYGRIDAVVLIVIANDIIMSSSCHYYVIREIDVRTNNRKTSAPKACATAHCLRITLVSAYYYY